MGFSRAQVEEAQVGLSSEGSVEAVLERLLAGPGLDSTQHDDVPMPPAAVHSEVSSGGKESQLGASSGAPALQGNIVVLGVSQFDYGSVGSSACTSIAIMAITALLGRYGEINAAAFENEEVASTCLAAVGEGVSSVGTGVEHQSVDEVWMQLSASTKLLDKVDFLQGILKSRIEVAFEDITEKIQHLLPDGDEGGIVGVALTKPPLTVAVFAHKAGKDVTYAIFDSHSRPELGINSAYFCQSLTLKALVGNLQKLFPRISSHEEELAVELMYHSYEAHFFKPR